ncbi:MAG: archease [Syntrophotaleaceae bacterium]
MNYRLLEHTADMGIEVTGNTLEELFFAAALGLREIVFGDQAVEGGQEEFPVEVLGGDAEELLVNWLNELLFLMQDRSVFPRDFHLRLTDEQHLRGRVLGFSRPCIEPVREVKAATFHQLNITQRNGRWQSRIYVDL